MRRLGSKPRQNIPQGGYRMEYNLYAALHGQELKPVCSSGNLDFIHGMADGLQYYVKVDVEIRRNEKPYVTRKHGGKWEETQTATR
jgi:hypothetical protein